MYLSRSTASEERSILPPSQEAHSELHKSGKDTGDPSKFPE